MIRQMEGGFGGAAQWELVEGGGAVGGEGGSGAAGHGGSSGAVARHGGSASGGAVWSGGAGGSLGGWSDPAAEVLCFHFLIFIIQLSEFKLDCICYVDVHKICYVSRISI